jgi:hypothetical protein
MNTDTVAWRDPPEGCSRCATPEDRYINPYWAPTKHLCPTCCRELDRLYTKTGWPPKESP